MCNFQSSVFPSTPQGLFQNNAEAVENLLLELAIFYEKLQFASFYLKPPTSQLLLEPHTCPALFQSFFNKKSVQRYEDKERI
jgi:hypothetical protein